MSESGSFTLKNLPGPTSLLGLRSLRAFQRGPIEFLENLRDKFGDIASFRLGPVNAVLVNNPELIREVLITQHEKFPKLGRQTKTIRLIDGESLFVKTGPQWATDRKVIQSVFQPSRLANYAVDVVDQTRKRIDSWQSARCYDFNGETMKLAILIAGRTLFGTDLSPYVETLCRWTKHRSDLFVKEMGAPVRIPDHWPLPSKRRKQKMIRGLDQLLYGIMENKRIEQQRQTASDRQPGQDLLSTLLASQTQSGMSDQQIRDHANMLFQAAVDDIGTGLVWLFYLLAQHPEIQQAARDQIFNVLGNHRIKYEDLKQIPLVNQIVNETLRMYPPTWLFTARKAICDLEIGGYPIKHRSWVFVSPYVTQRDGRFFENPTVFEPQRFVAERFDKLQQSVFFPFGMGPRACAGARFSMMELALVAATVLQQFEWVSGDGQSEMGVLAKVTVRPSRPVKIIVNRILESGPK